MFIVRELAYKVKYTKFQIKPIEQQNILKSQLTFGRGG